MYKYLLIISALYFISSCNNDPKIGVEKTEKKSELKESIASKKEVHPGRQLMVSNCYSCHNPLTDDEARLAPRFSEIKKAYNAQGINEKKYIKAMMNWIKDPKVSSSKMPEMIKKYGIMPQMTFSDTDEKLIAEYIYNYNVSEEKEEELLDGEFNYKKEGMKYAMLTKKQLGKNLMGQLNSNGTIAALEFCNTKALFLTDSVSNANYVKVSRVSDKPRNTSAQANAKELKYLDEYHLANTKGEEMKPHVDYLGNQVVFYSPITTNPMCMQCHGVIGKDIKSNVYNKIKALYPEDMAVGYKPQQIRGMFKVVMDKQ